MFKVGSIVMLKCGGPDMVILEIGHALVRCNWFDESSLKVENFQISQLKLVENIEDETGILLSVEPISAAQTIETSKAKIYRVRCCAKDCKRVFNISMPADENQLPKSYKATCSHCQSAVLIQF